jgi:phenylacetate-coenzyme A ligase PaaK-like adenylate-forming protein
MKHYWFGEIIDSNSLKSEIDSITSVATKLLEQEILPYDLIKSCDLLSKNLKEHGLSYDILLKNLNNENDDDLNAEEMLLEIANFLSEEHLKSKLARELGEEELNDLSRISFQRNIFETWSPLGILTHIAPGNAPAISFLAIIEGMLAGNRNILKLSSKDSDFCIKAIQELSQYDDSDTIKKGNAILRISSENTELLNTIIKISDGVSAWGGDEAIKSISNMLPSGVRLIPWGHKISFGLVSQKKIMCEETIKKIAADCILMNQQACSSPQTILLESKNKEEIDSFSIKLLAEMEKQSLTLSAPRLSLQEQTEITNISEVVRLEGILGKSKLLQSENLQSRVFIDYSEGLSLSPLYRSIWIRPVSQNQILTSLFPLRQYLQTCGLSCSPDEFSVWSKLLLKSGVLRITNPGEMLNSYEGEPHDGVYALNRFMKRVRCEHDTLKSHYRASSLDPSDHLSSRIRKNNIMTKEDFQNQVPVAEKSKLYFRSGGSGGKPAISTFSYEDYHAQMQAAAEGLFAAGLSPESDRVMNLFFGGGLYGGFLSFFTILEKLKAVQFPMQAIEDTEMVADTIISNGVNTLVGMPSYILGLFKNNKDQFKEFRVVKKIFYGGEHLLPEQKSWLKEEFGIETIRAASYGSVDAGPLGYQCEFMEGSEYHLNHTLHSMEILNRDVDRTVTEGELGRLVFTSFKRNSQKIERYDVGDLGISLSGACLCGRKSKRFELKGRAGDIFRAAGTFFNYQKFIKILTEKYNYSGELQILISKSQDLLRDKLIISIDIENIDLNPEVEKFFENYKDLSEAVVKEKCLDFDIKKINYNNFIRIESSGKLRRVVDLR